MLWNNNIEDNNENSQYHHDVSKRNHNLSAMNG